MKNRFMSFLKKLGIDDLFVFCSINWSTKGQRVLQIIKEMNLREVNVLFIDDNPINRSEVQNICPNIMVTDINVIPELAECFSKAEQMPKKDAGHKRLEQYKILEKKQAFKSTAGSNEEFLKQSGISVEILDDCAVQIERIEELVLRSN